MTTKPNTCKCGEPLTMEMERDRQLCADCIYWANYKMAAEDNKRRFWATPAGPVR